MTITIQLAQRGVLTLSKPLREAYKLKNGDVFTVTDLGEGMLLLRRERSKIDDLIDDIVADLTTSGETLETMLTRLRSKREAQCAEPSIPQSLS